MYGKMFGVWRSWIRRHPLRFSPLQRLGGSDTSASGIFISRAMTERPELFWAAICNIGVANAMCGEFATNGPVNTPEFGTVKDPIEGQALYEMDDGQHVQPEVKYPAILCVGGWNDPRSLSL